MSADGKHLHILFFPMLESGHIIPMIDIAKLFSRRGVRCTFVTTAGNADVVRAATKVDASIHIHILPFPSSVDPQGRDKLSSYSTKAERLSFIHSLHHLRPSLQAAVHDLRPDAIVDDIFYLPWTTPLFGELGLPQLVFHSSNAFLMCAFDSFLRHNLEEATANDVLPGLPHRIELRRTPITPPQKFPRFHESWEALKKCYGIVINSFYELEPEYAQRCREVLGKRTWHIGPVSLCNSNDDAGLSVRGAATGRSSEHASRCKAWLDSKPAASVLYICFGSTVEMSNDQLREISVALESTRHPFLWVVRDSPEPGAASSSWFTPALKRKEAAEECVVARGWVPQLLILNHPSIGGFMTHCGWNSAVEGVSAGVPMATWPRFGDQFYGEMLLVDILKTGVAVGANNYAVVADEPPLIAAADIKAAVDQLMDECKEKQDRLLRAKKLAARARRAVEVGGSSYEDIGRLIRELEDRKNRVNGE